MSELDKISRKRHISVGVNGKQYAEDVESRMLLVHFIREQARIDWYSCRM